MWLTSVAVESDLIAAAPSPGILSCSDLSTTEDEIEDEGQLEGRQRSTGGNAGCYVFRSEWILQS